MAELIMLAGVPGCGKTTFAQRVKEYDPDTEVFSSDEIRAELYPNVEYGKIDNNVVFMELQKRVRLALRQDKKCIYDATNMNAKKRRAFLKTIRKIEAKKSLYLLHLSVEDLIERDQNREATVGVQVIEKFIKQFEMPLDSEGWDEIRLIDMNTDSPSYKLYLAQTVGFDQDNAYHSLTLADHLMKAKNLAKIYGIPILFRYGPKAYSNLIKAAMLHDVGKVHTKTEKNSRGAIDYYTKDGVIKPSYHYYRHENVSAYMVLNSREFKFTPRECNLSSNRVLAREQRRQQRKAETLTTITTLVNYHMKFKTSTISQEALIAIYGKKMYHMLKVLEKCDEGAR